MRNKVGNKRKTRHVVEVAARLIGIFAVTFIFLTGYFLFFQHTKPNLITPIVTAQKQALVPVATDPVGTLTQLLQGQNILYSSTTIATDSSILVTLTDGPTVDFSQTKNFMQQIASLQLITQQLTIEGRQAKWIDLRFDNPIVSF